MRRSIFGFEINEVELSQWTEILLNLRYWKRFSSDMPLIQNYYLTIFHAELFYAHDFFLFVGNFINSLLTNRNDWIRKTTKFIFLGRKLEKFLCLIWKSCMDFAFVRVGFCEALKLRNFEFHSSRFSWRIIFLSLHTFDAENRWCK